MYRYEFFVTFPMPLIFVSIHIFSCILNWISYRTWREILLPLFFVVVVVKASHENIFYAHLLYRVLPLFFLWVFDIACECVYNATVFCIWKGEQKKKRAIEISSHSFSLCRGLLKYRCVFVWIDFVYGGWNFSIANVCTNVLVRHYCICVTLFSLYYEIYSIFFSLGKCGENTSNDKEQQQKKNVHHPKAHSLRTWFTISKSQNYHVFECGPKAHIIAQKTCENQQIAQKT